MIYRQPVPPPKNGRYYRVIAVCRISTDHQSEMSLDDQRALYDEWLDRNLDGHRKVEVIAGRGSGEILDRAEYIDLCDRIDSGDYDLVITEDLGRICRRVHSLLVCEAGVDSATRVVAINDYVDTLDENWHQNAAFASVRHESYNRDTSGRIKRTLRNRFTQGGIVQVLPYGYVKPHSGAADEECFKEPEAEPVYDEWFDRLEAGQTFAEIADWLNVLKIPTGPGAQSDNWHGTLVGQTTYNPILKGQRRRNDRMAKRVNSTGKRKTVKAPADMLLVRDVPHLAFIAPDRYDRVIRLVRQRNAKFCKKNSPDGRLRRDSHWPAQHLRCGICGRPFVCGGHGRKTRMMCNGARSHQCWVGLTVDRVELANAISLAVVQRIESLPNFDEAWSRQLNVEADELASGKTQRLHEVQRQREALSREISNYADSIAKGIVSRTLEDRLTAAELRLVELDDQLHELASQQLHIVEVPSAAAIRETARQAFVELAVESREFGCLMREIIEELYVLPYRLLDGGHIECRCIFTLNLAPFSDIAIPRELEVMKMKCVVDLTKSPQRVAFREQTVSLRAEGKTEEVIAGELGITKTAVQRAASLDRKMRAAGVGDPWIPVTSDQQAVGYYKRIRHKRYRFSPLPGFEVKFPAD